jgi:hypothetical protein
MATLISGTSRTLSGLSLATLPAMGKFAMLTTSRQMV